MKKLNVNDLIDEMIEDINFVKGKKFFDTFGNEIEIKEWDGNMVVSAMDDNFILDRFDVMDWIEDYKNWRRNKIINKIIKNE